MVSFFGELLVIGTVIDVLIQDDDNASNESESDSEPIDISSNESESEDLVHDKEPVDNSIEGVTTDEILPDDLQKQVRKVIDAAREIVNITTRTPILSACFEKQRINCNLKVSKNKCIRHRLSNDVKTRWIPPGNIGITIRQRKRLALIERTNDQ